MAFIYAWLSLNFSPETKTATKTETKLRLETSLNADAHSLDWTGSVSKSATASRGDIRHRSRPSYDQ